MNCFDVTVILGREGSIITDLYTKPTDSHANLDYRFEPPKNCRSGIRDSKFLRLKRICSNPDTFTQICREIHNPPKVMKQAFNRVYTLLRGRLLTPKSFQKTITTFYLFLRNATIEWPGIGICRNIPALLDPWWIWKTSRATGRQ